MVVLLPRTRRAVAVPALLALLTLATAGCPSQALLQSAATIPAGKVQHQIGLEWFSVRYREPSPTVPGGTPTTTESSYALPIALPFYGTRIGVAERLDVGIRVSAALTLGFDLKLQIIDTEAVDVAIAPGFQFAWIWSWMQLPLLIGLNAGDAVQIQLSGRLGYVVPMEDGLTGIDEIDAAFGERGMFAGGGLGLYLRLGERVALVPEVQVLRGTGSSPPTLVSVGVGIAFGTQPGVQPAPPPPMPPPAPPPGAYPPGYPVGSPVYATPPTGPPQPPPPPGGAPAVPPGYEQAPPAPPQAPQPAPPGSDPAFESPWHMVPTPAEPAPQPPS